jgi:hypothetical protein
MKARILDELVKNPGIRIENKSQMKMVIGKAG